MAFFGFCAWAVAVAKNETSSRQRAVNFRCMVWWCEVIDGCAGMKISPFGETGNEEGGLAERKVAWR
jgi:hypothetical protein